MTTPAPTATPTATPTPTSYKLHPTPIPTRPPDFSGRAWWAVSVEAKLLLQVGVGSLAPPLAHALLPTPDPKLPTPKT